MRDDNLNLKFEGNILFFGGKWSNLNKVYLFYLFSVAKKADRGSQAKWFRRRGSPSGREEPRMATWERTVSLTICLG